VLSKTVRVLGDAALVLLVLVALLPFVFMALTSLQRSNSISLAFDFSKLDLTNYVRLFTEYGFARALMTSVIVVVLACTVNVFVCSLAAYAFAKKPFPGSEVLFWAYAVYDYA